MVDYMEAWDLQRDLADRVRDGEAPAHLVLLEHPPTYTFGARGKEEHLLVTREMLAGLGAQVYRVDRGGDITYHGPGQLVGYPILDLRALDMGPVDYVRGLEDVLIRTLDGFGIAATTMPGKPGVWVDERRKIAAIGVHIGHNVTTHGFALNVATDLEFFRHIVACGLPDSTVTSMEQLRGTAPVMVDVEQAFADLFGERFGFEMVEPAQVRRGAER